MKINELVHIRLDRIGIGAADIAIGHIDLGPDIATDMKYTQAGVAHILDWVSDILLALTAHLAAGHVAVVAGAVARTVAGKVEVMRRVLEAQEADYMVKMVAEDKEVEVVVNTRIAAGDILLAVAQPGHSERTCSCRVYRRFKRLKCEIQTSGRK